jgi:hypothetical protein
MLLAAICLSRRDRCPNCRVTPILRGIDFDVFAFLAPYVDLRSIARGIDDRIRPPFQFSDYRLTGSSGGTEDENSVFFACVLVIHVL